MRISENLNLIVPIYNDDDSVGGYVHSTPLSRAAFEANYLLISATFSAIYGEGLGEMAGPRVAALILRDVAKARNADADAFLNEIRRLSCFIFPGALGWEQVPLHEAVSRKIVSDDDYAEVLNALVFFTVVSAMLRRRTRDILPGAVRLWGAETSSLLPMEWTASLQTSTGTDSSGATEPPASSGATATIMVQGNPTS